MAAQKQEKKYTKFALHIEPKAKIIDYRQYFSWKTITSLEELEQLFTGKTKFAFDTETTGLNPDIAKIVGYSFSFNGTIGYYVPLLHKIGENAPRETLDFIVDKIRDPKSQVYMYNKKFDLNMIDIAEGYGLHIYFNVYDAMSLVWLRDTDVAMPSLKDASEHLLGIQQPRLDDVKGQLTFDFTTIEEATEYASLDAICTYKLLADTITKQPDLKSIFKLDNDSIEAIRVFEYERVKIDRDFLIAEERTCLEKINKIKESIFDFAGNTFNLNSDRQVSEALLKAGAHLTEKTKPSKTFPQGQWQVSKEVLERVDHPLAELLIEYSKEFTYYNSFVKKLKEESEQDGRLRFNYKCMATATGRFSSGMPQSKKNKEPNYYAHINAQNIPKSKQTYMVVYPDSNSVTGWSILDDEEAVDKSGNVLIDLEYDEYYVCETGSAFHGIRMAFLPETDHVFVSIDYSGEELRIAANLSGEPLWIDTILKGGDLHLQTAKQIWGEGANTNHRKIAKSVNFGILYGGTDYTLHKNLNLPRNEAKQLYESYNRALPVLNRWRKSQKKIAKTEGVIKSPFGRPYRLGKFFKLGNSWGKTSFGERCALNYPVQGGGSDVIRLALKRLLKFRVAAPQYTKAYKFISTVHDEINFSVHKRWLHQFVTKIPKLMYMEFKGWSVPLEVDIGIGDNWGRCISYTYNKETKTFTPIGNHYKK